MSDPMVEALRRLVHREGGYAAVADAIGASDQTIYQILSGVKLPSGAAKGVGPSLRKRLTASYPDWLNTQHPSVGAETGGAVAQVLSYPKFKTGLTVKFQVPVIGTLTVGADDMFELRSSADGQPIGHVPAFEDQAVLFAVRVFGDELYPAVRHGACLVIDPAGPIVQGELVLMESVDGYYLVCELVADRADTITVLPAKGGRRKTFERHRFAAIHPVVDIAAASRFSPRAKDT